MAFICGTVAPFSAHLVAAISRRPWHDFATPTARAASANILPNASLERNGSPLAPTIKARSPQGPASRALKYWQDRQVYLSLRLLSGKRRRALADMLPADTAGVAAPKAGIHKNVKPHSLARADRPLILVGGNVFLSPRFEAFASRSRWVGNASSRIGLNVLRLTPPAKHCELVQDWMIAMKHQSVEREGPATKTWPVHLSRRRMTSCGRSPGLAVLL